MTDVLHGTVEQSVLLEAPIDLVWRAFTDLELRDRWFSMPGSREGQTHELDFRIGGTETATGTLFNVDHDERLEHRSRFIDIVEPDRGASGRVTTVYDFLLNDELKLASLLSIELHPDADGTRLDYLEQYQYFGVVGDGSAERGERAGGTRFLLRRLGIALQAG
ncbi:MAG: SRPBCC domain-containing protein [Actinomycetota bacterium]